MNNVAERAGTIRAAIALLSLLLAGFNSQASAQAVPTYTLNAGDTLDIAVWKEEDLTKKDVIVRPDGMFSYPLAGEINAVGHTVAQVEEQISSRLKKYIPEPVVSVSVKNLDGCRVYVIGQVGKPGSFVMNPRFSVLQALSLAGGLTPFAAANDIIILRGNGNAQNILPFHYGEVTKGRSLNQNVLLEAGDVVVVP
jgi:polysaccharide export outer membrane protein